MKPEKPSTQKIIQFIHKTQFSLVQFNKRQSITFVPNNQKAMSDTHSENDFGRNLRLLGLNELIIFYQGYSVHQFGMVSEFHPSTFY